MPLEIWIFTFIIWNSKFLLLSETSEKLYSLVILSLSPERSEGEATEESHKRPDFRHRRIRLRRDFASLRMTHTVGVTFAEVSCDVGAGFNPAPTPFY